MLRQEEALLGPTAIHDGIVLVLARDWPCGRKYEVELEAAVAGCDSSEAKAEF